MKWFSNLPFKYRIFFSCVLIALVPLILSAVLTTRIFYVSLNRQANQEGHAQLEEITTRFTQFFAGCESACESLALDGTASWVMIDNSTFGIERDLYLSMYQAVQEVYGYASFALYDVGGQLRFSTDSYTNTPQLPLHWGLLRKAAHSDGIVYYGTDPYLSPSSPILMQAAYALDRPGGARTGYMVLNFTQKSFEHLLNSYYSSQDTFLLLDNHQNLIYCSRPEYSHAAISAMVQEAMSGFYDSADFQYMWSREPSSGYYILLRKDAPVGSSALHIMQTISLLLALLGLALCLVISLLLSRSISLPVSRLDRAMAKVKDGDLSVRVHANQKDELGRLTERFNQMTCDLQKYLDDTVQKQKDLNETQLRLYQSQLNPHFLYNTLDSIKWTAKMNQLPEIATMAEDLAVILRRSISSRPFITLEQELETLDNYIQIQKIRFSGRFLYELEIPDHLTSCLIPKMILQPLVENAIIHGLEGSECGYICIYASQSEGSLYISVTDDGRGMGEEMLNWINSSQPEKKEGHLGLYNVIQILKLYYGPEYGLKAALSAEGGTIVTVILPMQEGAAQYV